MMNLVLSFMLFFSVTQTDPVKEELKIKLQESTECWNDGNLECFMQTYWKSDSLKFIGGNGVTYGWENTLQRYKVGYPTEKERGILSFYFSIGRAYKQRCLFYGGQISFKTRSR